MENKLVLNTVVVLLLSAFNVAHAQDNTPVKPSNYSGSVNYVRVWDAQVPITDATVIMTRPLREVKMSTQYFDGLGRPVETVIRQGSVITGSTPVDMVTAQSYDEFGRDVRKYLPFASNGNGALIDGSFKTDPFDQQVNFYSDVNINSPIKGQGETFYYSKTEFEPSPLNRVDRTYAAGNSWVGGSGKGVKVKYWTNTDNDAVRIWNVNDVDGDFGTYTTSGAYTAGMLYKNVTEDERGKQTIEFKDKDGHVVLKKIQLDDNAYDDGTTGKDNTGWLCTYYIYDDLGQLRCVIQPEGVKTLAANGWDLNYNNAVLLNEQCFRYEYDGRGRLIMKKVPGAGAVYMVYDKRDRPTMMQDGNMRNGTAKWLVTIYDDMNRPMKTGLWADPNSRSYHEGQAAGSVNDYYPFNSEPSSNWELLTETHYNDYSGLPSGLSSSFNPSGYTTYLNASSSSSEFADAVPSSPSSLTKGAVTWSRTRVLGTADQFLATANLYDDKGRLVQAQNINVTGGLDVITTQYSFSGQALRNHVNHQKLTGTPQNYEVATKNTYDDLGRISMIEKAVGSTTYNQVSSLNYDALGQLKNKKLAPAFNNNSGLETQKFDYNIRGWLLGINRTDLTGNGSGTSKFAFDLGYDKLTNGSDRNYQTTQLNGNISGMIWKSAGDGIRRKYDFSYDNINRLMQGLFEQNNSEDASWNNSKIDYTVKMGNGTDPLSAYDANSNIISMTQYGWKPGQPGGNPIDNLSYSYFPNSNKLRSVTDLTGTTDNKLGDFTDRNSSGDDYGYDVNGNLITDLNKRINGSTGTDLTSGGAINYNYLNLPQSISVKNDDNATLKGSIEYVYDAGGNKLKKIVHETGQPDKTTLYLFGTYENDILQFLPQEEGRIRPLRDVNNNIASFTFDYFIKDHLGNVRMVLTDEQKQDVYPAATLEGNIAASTDAIYVEKNYYSINTDNIVNEPSGMGTYQNNNGNPPYNNNPNSNTSANSQKVYQLIASSGGGVTGLGMTLKVMSGDRIDIFGKSYYNALNSGGTNYAVPVLDILNGIFNAPGSTAGEKGITAGTVNGISSITGAVLGFLSNPNRDAGSTPKAFINYILFDEQFKYVGGGFSRIGSNHASDLSNIPITKNGYIYVYVSNESPVAVFFDNLQVIHTRGPILEETHYYPFGLTMAGISDKTLKSQYAQNKYRYNGKELQNQEFSDGSGLEEYDYGARFYDQQIGRWSVIDPKIDLYNFVTPYGYCLNNPLKYVDPRGEDIYLIIWYSADGEIGHSAIAVDNYKTVEKKDKNGKTMLDKDGKAITEQVKDGTVTYYDFWPGSEGGAGKSNFDKNQNGLIQKKEGLTLNDIMTKDIGSGEQRPAEGIIQLTANPTATQKVHDAANTEYENQEKDKVQYNGACNNCSNFALNLMKQIYNLPNNFGIENINTNGNKWVLIPKVNINSVTPNFLYRSSAQMVTGNPALGKILKSDTKKAGNDFVNAVGHGFVSDITPGH